MPTLQEALDTFLLVERRPQTNRQYGFTLARMVAAIGPARAIALIRFEDLLDYQAQIRVLCLASTVGNYTSIIKSFFAWCTKRGYLDRNPAVDLPRVKPRRDPTVSRAVPSDDLRRMVEYTRLTSARNYALLLFLCDTGCRVSGLTSLTVSRLHVDEGFAYIEEKGGYWHRATFGEETASALSAWLGKRPAVDHDFVWTGRKPGYEPIKRGAVQSIIARLSKETGASRIWKPHAIRHAVGHAWAKAGIPPHVTQEKLGHHHITTTLTFYYPQRDPYVDVASRHLALAALRDGDDLHRQERIIDIDTHPKRRAR